MLGHDDVPGLHPGVDHDEGSADDNTDDYRRNQLDPNCIGRHLSQQE